VVAAIVVSFPHAHTVVGEVDIAIVAEELGHRVALGFFGEWVRSGAINVKADGLGSASQELRAPVGRAWEESRHRHFLIPMGLGTSINLPGLSFSRLDHVVVYITLAAQFCSIFNVGYILAKPPFVGFPLASLN
jgi:hypothetical protein